MKQPAMTRQAPPCPVHFRVADRMRIEACVKAVAQEGMSLALSCEREALLDHYFDLLLARLKEVAPQHRIDVYFPSNTESLLARFNEILAEQSLDQAFQSVPVAEKALLWIVHDAQSLPAQEIQLLARLIQNLPGANIRALLLLHGPDRHQTPLSTFGRRIVRWDIDIPNEEQAAAALEQARAVHCEAPMRQLLGRIGHELPAEDEDAGLPERSALPLQADPSSTPPAAAARTVAAQPRRRLPTLLAILTLFSIATFVSWWMQPEAFDALRSAANLLPTQSLQPQTVPAPATAPAPVPTPVPPAPMPPAPMPLPPIAPAAADPLPRPAAPVPDAPASGPPPASTMRPITVVPQPTAPVMPSPAPAAKPPSAEAWLRALDPRGFLVQSGSMPTRAQAEQLQAAFPDLAGARIVNAWRKQRSDPVFLIVSGPYPSLPHAQQAMRGFKLPQGSWIRTTISVQEQLNRNPAPQ